MNSEGQEAHSTIKNYYTLETYRPADEREGLGGHVLMGRRGGQGPQASRQRTDRVDRGVHL